MVLNFQEPPKRKQDNDPHGIDSGPEESDNRESDEKNLLPASHYIGDKYLWEMTEKIYPQISDKENDQIFTVPTIKIEIEDKLGQNQQPRFLEDEGMYVGTKPVHPKGKNQNKMEQRILKEQSVKGTENCNWFGSDGKLVALPNPLSKKATRPPNYEDESNMTDPLTFFCPPTLPGNFENSLILI